MPQKRKHESIVKILQKAKETPDAEYPAELLAKRRRWFIGKILEIVKQINIFRRKHG